MLRKTHFLLLAMGLVFCSLLVREARATIVLFGNETLSYPSLDAAFSEGTKLKCPRMIVELQDQCNLFTNRTARQSPRRFGCPAWYYIPKETRKKLDDKAKKGIFVGYAENAKAYEIFVPETKKNNIGMTPTGEPNLFYMRSDASYKSSTYGLSNESLCAPRDAPQIPAAGIVGEINIAEPLNGCSALDVNSTAKSAFVIVVRGDCLFETKVRNGQNAGFTVVIVFSNEDNDEVITMSGNGTGIRTFAVFVSKEAGDKLLSLEGLVHIYLLSDARKATWTIKWLIISVSLIVIVIVGSLLAALCCIRRHILAEAEKNFFHEKLLNDDHYISSRESGLYDHGPEVQNAQDIDVMTYTEGEHNYVFRSEGPSDSDHASDTSNRTPPK